LHKCSVGNAISGDQIARIRLLFDVLDEIFLDLQENVTNYLTTVLCNSVEIL